MKVLHCMAAHQAGARRHIAFFRSGTQTSTQARVAKAAREIQP